MSDAPISVPLDKCGAPDLTLLVRQLGQAVAKARGEEYDPAHNPAHAGYPLITPAMWPGFDDAWAAPKHARRIGLARASLGKAWKHPRLRSDRSSSIGPMRSARCVPPRRAS